MSQYTTGTVTVTNGDQTVTGSGTAWTGEVSPGDTFTVASSGVVYQVASVTSDTALELVEPYAGVNGSGRTYAIGRDFTTARGFPYPNPGDTEIATILKRAIIEIDAWISSLTYRVSTQFDKTSDTTLANVTGLSADVEAGKTYKFSATLYTTSNVAGGVKCAVAGTATATAIIYEAKVLETGVLKVPGTTRATALATAVGDITAVTVATVHVDGLITVNAAGTLTVQFAQNASNGTASSVLVGSNFSVVEVD